MTRSPLLTHIVSLRIMLNKLLRFATIDTDHEVDVAVQVVR